MSNRKLRTNKVEVLYLMANKDFFPDRDMLHQLIKSGYIKQKRSPADRRKPNSQRRNSYVLTDKAWQLLARRRRSLDQRVRVQRALWRRFPYVRSSVFKGNDVYELFRDYMQPSGDYQ